MGTVLLVFVGIPPLMLAVGVGIGIINAVIMGLHRVFRSKR